MENPRCSKCRIMYKGNNYGSYHPKLKTLYERKGSKGVFVKAGYICPECRTLYNLEDRRLKKFNSDSI